jgi:acetyl esterase/lipase
LQFRYARLSVMALLAAVIDAHAAPAAQSTIESDVHYFSDVQYCTGGGKPLLMDVFIPQQRNADPTPAILWIHGGGWEHGDKSGNSLAKLLAGGGFVTATLNYRLSGDAPFPAAVEDCKCAIRFLRANAARYGIDPARIGVAGSSAGGHLAELLATAGPTAGLEGDGGWPDVSSRVQAAASYFGVSDLTQKFPADTVPYIVKFLRGTGNKQLDLYRKASPISYVTRDAAPLLLVHGENDDGVPFDQSVRMSAAYRQAGLTAEFIQVKNAGHDFQHVGDAPISPSVEAIQERTVDFFRRTLLAGERSAAGASHDASTEPHVAGR